MAIVPANPTQGQALFEGTQSFYSHDDAADNKNGGVYEHLAIEWSANEAEALCDWARYINGLLLSGSIAVEVRNETGAPLPAGPVKLSGYNATEDRHLVVLPDADGSSVADLWLNATLADATNGVGYTDTLVSGVDTSTASAVGDPVYLSATGSWTLTAPSGADQAVQVIGAVKVKAVSGVIAARIFCPKKFGTTWIQDQAITLAKLVNASAQGKLVGRSTAAAGAWEEVAPDGSTLELPAGGSLRVKDAGITYAKIQNVSATDKILGRSTAGAGSVEEITCTSAGRAILDDADATAQVATLGLSSAPVWIKINKTHTNLQAAALTNNISLYTLPAGGIIHACKIKHSVAFAGTGITAYTLSVGTTAGGAQELGDTFNVFQAAAAATFGLTGGYAASYDNGSTTDIKLYATAVGANLDQSSAGTVDVWLLVSIAV